MLQLSGSITALVTPLTSSGIDEAAFRDLVDWQIEQGSTGLVPCGTTGESSTLTLAEHDRVVELCVLQARGRVPVIAGCGSNDTATSIEHMRKAKLAGADAALVVLPYYNRPRPSGVIAHFSELVCAVDLPIIVYNVPPRTGIDLDIATLVALTTLDGVIGIKDASGDVARVGAYRQVLGTGFAQLSGCDDSALGHRAMGGQGCISVTSNVLPLLCAEQQAACDAGDWARALAINDRLFPLHQALFSDASPGPTKYAISRLIAGFPTYCRSPIGYPGEASIALVDAALRHAASTA